MPLDDTITIGELYARLGTAHVPIILDVRRDGVFAQAPDVIPASRRAVHAALHPSDYADAPNGVVAVCVHGHNVSQLAAARLRAEGIAAAWLIGGIEAWKAAGLPVVARAPDAAGRYGAGTIWVTRRRPKIDRIACPWFIRRFVDDRARFLFVESDYVLPVAEEAGGIAFDVEGAPVTHDGPRCSFDTLLDRYAVADPVLRRLAEIVRGADTARPDLAPEAPGLLAISLGASSAETDDHVMLERLFPVYDALYTHLRFTASETHSWPPRARGNQA
jgi:rhodanese-related sulfurtransferase